jgi:hypothetical protein
MTVENRLSASKRRTRAEVQQLVAEFVSSVERRSEFCESRGLSFSTLHRHLKKRRWKKRHRPVSSAGRLVKVELAARKSPKQHERSCGVAVVLPGGRRIEVHPDFDTSTLERLVGILERVRASNRRLSRFHFDFPERETRIELDTHITSSRDFAMMVASSLLAAIPAGEWAMLFSASRYSAVSQIATGPSAYVR